jgi:carbonic anhydrase
MGADGQGGATERLIENNRAFAERRRGPAAGGRPALRVAVLACMDARLDPGAVLGLAEGDAHVIRNAGGIVTDDAIRSLAISQQQLGTEEIVLLHHTDCGMQTFADDEFAETLERLAGRRPGWSPGAFADVEQSLRDSIELLRTSPFLRTSSVRGFVYDVQTGLLREVNSP